MQSMQLCNSLQGSPSLCNKAGTTLGILFASSASFAFCTSDIVIGVSVPFVLMSTIAPCSKSTTVELPPVELLLPVAADDGCAKAAPSTAITVNNITKFTAFCRPCWRFRDVVSILTIFTEKSFLSANSQSFPIQTSLCFRYTNSFCARW